MNSSEVEE